MDGVRGCFAKRQLRLWRQRLRRLRRTNQGVASRRKFSVIYGDGVYISIFKGTCSNTWTVSELFELAILFGSVWRIAESEDTHRAIHGAALGRSFCDNNSTKSEPGINCRERTVGSNDILVTRKPFPVLPPTIEPHIRDLLKFHAATRR
jgi:hypothetical protein